MLIDTDKARRRLLEGGAEDSLAESIVDLFRMSAEQVPTKDFIRGEIQRLQDEIQQLNNKIEFEIQRLDDKIELTTRRLEEIISTGDERVIKEILQFIQIAVGVLLGGMAVAVAIIVAVV